jgi:NTE family protein
VLFLTGVWGWSTLDAGLAAVPAALASAIGAPLGGRWAARYGPRPVAILGAVMFAASLLWVVASATTEPDYLGVWLPYAIVGGAGIGIGLPTLIGATATGLPATRFATGMALATTARQLGAVLGVALLVAVVGTPTAGEALSAYDAGFALCAAAALISAGAAMLLRPEPRARPSAAARPVAS